MKFDTEQKILKFSPVALFSADSLAEQYGEEINGVKTLLKWNDSTNENSKERPARATVDFKPTPLTDGNFAAIGFWTLAALEAIGNGDVEGVEEITLDQFNSLSIKPQNPRSINNV